MFIEWQPGWRLSIRLKLGAEHDPSSPHPYLPTPLHTPHMHTSVNINHSV